MNVKLEKKFRNIIKEHEYEQEPPEYVNKIKELLDLSKNY